MVIEETPKSIAVPSTLSVFLSITAIVVDDNREQTMVRSKAIAGLAGEEVNSELWYVYVVL